ncbi:hypothetical protein ACFYUS_34630, partial [Streptomyces sp. NPDC004284]
MPGRTPETTESPRPDETFGEPRWPMAAAVVTAMVLTLLLPGDPGRIDRRTAALRSMSIALVGVLALSAVWSTVQLVDDIL